MRFGGAVCVLFLGKRVIVHSVLFYVLAATATLDIAALTIGSCILGLLQDIKLLVS